jgi:hypothetical protein
MKKTVHRTKCPFCETYSLEFKAGKSTCPECHAKYEIDENLESVFVDLQHPRLPVIGTFCKSCGLVQGNNRKFCKKCGYRLDTATQ